MSLAHRLKAVQPNSRNDGCQSCIWWKKIRPESRAAINEWLAAGHSIMQLHEIVAAPSDDDPDEPPLTVSLSGWRNHLKHHAETQ